MERKAQLEEKDMSTMSKLSETMIRKSKEYRTTFPQYRGDLKQGKAWCAAICYHALDYKVETVAAADVKFAIYGAIEINLRARVLHLEPGTIGFNSFTPAEYQEELLGRFINTRQKGRSRRSMG